MKKQNPSFRKLFRPCDDGNLEFHPKVFKLTGATGSQAGATMLLLMVASVWARSADGTIPANEREILAEFELQFVTADDWRKYRRWVLSFFKPHPSLRGRLTPA